MEIKCENSQHTVLSRQKIIMMISHVLMKCAIRKMSTSVIWWIWILFLCFCSIYGHCYGFHLIAGGEGRKHPFSSLVEYSSTAPAEFFYDFACQLSEYCLNREPQYFLNTRFWHDLFHGITHKCGKCFKSSEFVEW